MATNRCPNPSCEYFNRTLPTNAKVCPMCGTALGNMVAAAPTPSNSPATAPQVPPVVRPTYQTPAPSPTYQAPAPYTPPVSLPPAYAPPLRPVRPDIKLIHTSGREFCLQGEDGYIGRRAQSSNKMPDFDLTGIPHEGVVSRTHARIYWDWTQNVYLLVDNNSRNGTSLNGKLLSPSVHYRLNHGDSLQLGQNNLVCFTVSLM